jgi:hypothetical protein
VTTKDDKHFVESLYFGKDNPVLRWFVLYWGCVSPKNSTCTSPHLYHPFNYLNPHNHCHNNPIFNNRTNNTGPAGAR